VVAVEKLLFCILSTCQKTPPQAFSSSLPPHKSKSFTFVIFIDLTFLLPKSPFHYPNPSFTIFGDIIAGGC
jgi:hypothetical protein